MNKEAIKTTPIDEIIIDTSWGYQTEIDERYDVDVEIWRDGAYSTYEKVSHKNFARLMAALQNDFLRWEPASSFAYKSDRGDMASFQTTLRRREK